jgi:hypothetical protein
MTLNGNGRTNERRHDHLIRHVDIYEVQSRPIFTRSMPGKRDSEISISQIQTWNQSTSIYTPRG